MKNKLLIVVAVICAWGCSAPKYAYHFDHYDYNSGKKQSTATAVLPSETQTVTPAQSESPLVLSSSTLEASNAPAASMDTKTLAEKIKAMNKSEIRQLKKDVKHVVEKISSKDKKIDSDQKLKATKEMDGDLKMAIIFGAVAIVLTAFGGVSSVFWILGVVALVVAVVFLIKWLSRQ